MDFVERTKPSGELFSLLQAFTNKMSFDMLQPEEQGSALALIQSANMYFLLIIFTPMLNFFFLCSVSFIEQ